ncbi:MAG: glycosyltransferase family 39 protein [Saprospiraceae bacterium]|nr:glycosyltransferase family 39 protein [Saprospiraceae bacterium]
MKRNFRKTIKALLPAVSAAIALLLLAALWAGHEASIAAIASLAGQAEKAEKIAALVTPAKFRLLLLTGALLSAGCLAAWKWFDLLFDRSARFVTYTGSGVRGVFRSFFRSRAKYLLIIPLSASVYFAVTLPVSYDEAWTYLNFTTKSPIVSLAYYPVPNNHILHSLITNFTHYIPGLSPLFRLRISSILVNLLIWITAYGFVRRFFSEKAAWVAVAVGAMLFMSVYYSVMSRGYALVVLFFVGALYAAFHITESGGRLRHWAWFSVCSVLGFFTMPSFLYPFLTLQVWILVCNRQLIARQIAFGFATAAYTALLYLPVVAVNGIGALTANPFVRPISRQEVMERMPGYFADTLRDIFGMPHQLVAVFLAVSLSVLFWRYGRRYQSLAVVLVLMPFALLAAHSVIPFPRTFVYYGFAGVFLLVIAWHKEILKINAAWLPVALLGIQVTLFFNFRARIDAYEIYNTTYYPINQKIAGNKSYYFNTRTFDTNLSFELRIKGYEMTKQQRNFPPLYMSADSISGFDYIIIDKPFDRTVLKKPLFSDPYVNVYEGIE